MAFAASLSMYVAGMLLYGLTSFVTVPLNSYTTAARGKLSVGRTITLVSASFNFGAILGPIIGGLVGEKAGLHANFQFAAILFVISTAVIFFIQPQPIEAKPDGSGISNLRSLLHERYLRYLLLMFFIMFGLYLPQPLTQNFLQNERGISLAVIGQLLAVRSVGIVALNLILGHLNARFGYLLAQILMGFFILFLWLGDGLPFYFAAYLLMGSYITGRGLVFAMGRTLSGAANMGVAYGLLETVMALAMVLASPLAGYLYKFNPSWIYSTSLVLIIIGIFANLALSPVHRKDLISFEEREKA
jgi:predicted MFS family arabinose efflux permease